MNTNIKKGQKKSQQQESRQQQGPKKQGQNAGALQDNRGPHEQEHPETRLTR